MSGDPHEPVFAFRLETLTRIHKQLTWAEKVYQHLTKMPDLESTMLAGEWDALREGKAADPVPPGNNGNERLQ